MKNRYKTLTQRAQEFCASGENSPTLKEAYIGGVKSGYEELTEWRNPAEELPEEGSEVLCIVRRPYQIYAVLKHDARGWWQPFQEEDIEGWCAYDDEPIAWRPIHEL